MKRRKISEEVKLYLASAALAFVGAALWYSGDYYGHEAERQIQHTQFQAEAAIACRDAFERWSKS